MKNTKILIGSLVLTFFLAMLGACTSPSTGFYIEQDELKATHTVQQSPCPQEVGSLKIYDTYNADDQNPVDSVVVTASHPSIDVTFAGFNGNSATFDGKSEILASVWFNCNEAKSVDTDVTFELYRDGELVETVTVDIKVTVK